MQVTLWVFEEQVEGRPLSVQINERHENPKYLAGVHLPDNLRAEPDLLAAARDADYLMVVLPHQFVERTMLTLAGKLKPSVVAVSFAKACA